MKKGVMLTTAMGEFEIKESVEQILELKNAAGEAGDLNFTLTNLKDPEGEGFKASIIGGLYRAVREVGMPEPQGEQLDDQA